MRYVSIIILLLYFLPGAYGQKTAIADGPYIFHRGKSVVVESIRNGEKERDSFEVKKDHPPTVAVPYRQEAFFRVPLKKKLKNEVAEYKAPDKLFVLSDIEGAFKGFYQLLLSGGVINEQYHWTYGNGHLVVCGDIFDRGEEVTACLWLLYKLEEEAKQQGGHVHLIIGNHEVMNLSEDFRYVHPKYMQASAILGRNYAELYTPDTELGRWLRTKNIMERVGDYLFLHAGVSQEVNLLGLDLETINKRVRPLYDKEGIDRYFTEPAAAILFHPQTSPFWYRGYFTQPAATESQIDSTLQLYQVKKIIVGHTIVDSIHMRYHGKVVAVDVNHHTGNHQALVIDKGVFYRMDASGKKTRLK